MKVNDAVARSIVQYPLLFKSATYFLSRMKALDNMFQSHDWAPDGYLWEHENYVKPKPYGAETFEREFDHAYFQQIEFDNGKFADSDEMIEEGDSYWVMKTSPVNRNEFDTVQLLSKGAGLLHLPDSIQPDWVDAAEELVNYMWGYYEDPKRSGELRRVRRFDNLDWERVVTEQFIFLQKVRARIAELRAH